MIIEQQSKINSSMINKAVYNFTEKTLNVEFSTGAIYQYHNVDESVYEDFCKSESQGKFLNEQIKNKFEYTKLITD
jgi:hypothetical protein